MNRTPSENTKPIFGYAGVPTGAFASAVIDTRGFDHGHATFIVSAATGSATDVTAIKVQESDASGSGYTDITGAAFTALTTSNDDAAEFGSVQIRATKRYLKLIGTGGGSNDSALAVICILSNARDTGDNDATFVFEV